MPIFDYQCNVCESIIKDVFVYSWKDVLDCKNCGGSMTKLCCVPQMHIIPTDGIHLKHVCPGGKTFHSKNEMKRYAKKHDLELGALL